MSPAQPALATDEVGTRNGVTAYLFDACHAKKVDAWEDALGALDKDDLLWIDLDHAAEDEERRIRETLGIGELDRDRSRGRCKPSLAHHDGYLYLTVIGVSDSERDPEHEAVVIDCVVGANWIFTSRDADVAALDDFCALAEGDGEIGRLDAPSFLAALLEWVVMSYLRAFEEIEAELEDFDIDALTRPTSHPDRQIETLVAARRRVGHLRRTLAPHRELFAALSHSEFDPISTEDSSARFVQLAGRIDAVLGAAREVKDDIASSFDVLIVRTEHRTSEIIKILTIASILLLPGALLASVAGMNVNFKPETFFHSEVFWTVAATIVAVAVATLGLARQRRWF